MCEQCTGTVSAEKEENGAGTAGRHKGREPDGEVQMNELEQALLPLLNEDLIQLTISAAKKHITDEDETSVRRIQVRPVVLKGTLAFQTASYTKKQVFHENHTKEALLLFLSESMKNYKQLQAEGADSVVTVLSGKKGTLTVKKSAKKPQNREKECAGHKSKRDLSHNREKEYILPKDEPVPFLLDLGVQTKEGKIINSKYDKFRQINRFLEFVRDILPKLPKDRQISIVDFGCGKSYLTFALYYYLKLMNGLDVDIIGLDLKEDVIADCNRLKEKYGYDKLQFLVGDISRYEGRSQVDMVVTLHACDTATDYALAKAVKWGAQVILSVPCCQHELNRQISNSVLEPVLAHGLLKERMAALFTDGIRAALLQEAGYEVKVMEFIDMEHTPKNILLRCTKHERIRPKKEKNTEELLQFLNADPVLRRLLSEQGSI